MSLKDIQKNLEDQPTEQWLSNSEISELFDAIDSRFLHQSKTEQPITRANIFGFRRRFYEVYVSHICGQDGKNIIDNPDFALAIAKMYAIKAKQEGVNCFVDFNEILGTITSVSVKIRV